MINKVSFYENEVLLENFPELTLGDVPCFHKIKMVQNTVLKMGGLY